MRGRPRKSGLTTKGADYRKNHLGRQAVMSSSPESDESDLDDLSDDSDDESALDAAENPPSKKPSAVKKTVKTKKRAKTLLKRLSSKKISSSKTASLKVKAKSAATALKKPPKKPLLSSTNTLPSSTGALSSSTTNAPSSSSNPSVKRKEVWFPTVILVLVFWCSNAFTQAVGPGSPPRKRQRQKKTVVTMPKLDWRTRFGFS